MKVSIILGTVREGRQLHKATNYVASTLEARGAETDLIDLAQEPLPILGYKPHQNAESKQRIEKISRRLDESEAVILVTPEYRQGYFVPAD